MKNDLSSYFTSGLVGLVGLCSVAIAQSHQDTQYPALMLWADWLSNVSTGWNIRCGESTGDSECEDARAVLNQQYVYFIEAANKYKSEGTDCKAKLRPRCVQYEIMLAGFNINCGGRTKTDQCQESSKKITQEEIVLKKDMAKCLGNDL